MRIVIKSHPNSRYENNINWKYSILVFILSFPFYKIPYFETIPVLDNLFFSLKIVSFFILVSWCLLIRKKLDNITFLFILMEVFLIINTYIQKGDIYTCVVSAFSVIGLILVFNTMEMHIFDFINTQLFILEILIYANFLCIILFPNGMYKTIYTQNWLLGYYNSYTKYFLPALLFAFLYKEFTGKKMRAYMMLLITVITALTVRAGGTIACLLFVGIIYTFFKNRIAIFNYYNYWMMNLFFLFCVVVLKMQNYLYWFIDGVLGKWNSLLGRMKVWDIEWEMFKNSILFGYGYEFSLARIRENGWATHAHNMVLEILHQGGIIYIIFFILIIICAGKKIDRVKKGNVGKIISTIFAGWCMHALVEPRLDSFLLALFVVVYNAENINCAINKNLKIE